MSIDDRIENLQKPHMRLIDIMNTFNISKSTSEKAIKLARSRYKGNNTVTSHLVSTDSVCNALGIDRVKEVKTLKKMKEEDDKDAND